MNEITPTDLAARTDVTVIDVRESDEYAVGHVPGVTLIPLSELQQRADEVPTSETVYVICQGGGRSARATEYLSSLGVDAVNVIGGTSAWQLAGLPMSQGTQR